MFSLSVYSKYWGKYKIKIADTSQSENANKHLATELTSETAREPVLLGTVMFKSRQG